jgi:adenosylhomocysteinase
LISGGADVAIASCNPLSTQDDVAAALTKTGASVFGWKGETNTEYYENLEQVISILKKAGNEGKRLATIDDGNDLVSLIHQKHPRLIEKIVVGTEETTTGVLRLRSMEKAGALKYPVIAVNDNKTKHLFDNYYGTGQSTIDGILRSSSAMIAGSRFVVAGYGECGQGVAKCARGLGAIVSVTEVEPIPALKARMDGFEVVKMSDAAKFGDFFVTVTGDIDVITMEHIEKMKDGAILANSGHFDVEIDVKNLRQKAKAVERTRPGLERFTLKNGKNIYLCGEGRLVNLASAEGHPSVVMALSFMGQALALEYGVKNEGCLTAKVHVLPEAVDKKIAALQLEAKNIKIDRLTEAQRHYLNSWQAGT